MKNQTLATEFILLGFSKDLSINLTLFVLFFLIYVITVIGNCLIILMIVINPRLHTPMYFFICKLSFIDLCNSSSAIPKMLMDLLTTQPTVSLVACLSQVNVLLLIGTMECQLLVLMAYDRCLAICLPLRYSILMRWSMCHILIALIYLFSFLVILLPSLLMPVALCYPNQINHFMCESIAVLHLSCDKNYIKELVIFLLSFMTILLPFAFIIMSYVCIIISVLKIRSAGRAKAFSTCTSHVTVVAMYFGTGMVTYLGPTQDKSSNQGKYVSIFYVIIAPLLNPIIYSLNNREVKKTFKKLLLKCHFPFNSN
ncbi:olfactory receptor 1019-like [Hyla sarda]|uniref:olfactory receptor 1019-like n=1 Tax=Hyla sarda TaxID=327740 RepID=UPI0024C3325C|nr:olfactory receptor 1019-like [Hyla sarda]